MGDYGVVSQGRSTHASNLYPPLVSPTTHHLRGHLIAVWVQRRHQVDPRVLYQAAHSGVPVAVLVAQILHEQ